MLEVPATLRGDPRPQAAEDGCRWYVMQTKPRQEPRVVAHLRHRASAVTVYLPRIEAVRKRGGRRITSLEPLFPSYLFLRMKLTPPALHAVQWTPGAHKILGDGERPVEVPSDMITMIWQRTQPLGFVRVGLTMSPGRRVRILAGPFAGMEGIFERPTSRRDRVRILLEILGNLTPLEIDKLDLERV